jgi:hypothetical protein
LRYIDTIFAITGCFTSVVLDILKTYTVAVCYRREKTRSKRTFARGHVFEISFFKPIFSCRA